jgi:hypothetical protein
MFQTHCTLVLCILIYICLPHSWYPRCNSPCFSCAQNTQMMIPPFDLMRSVGLGRCLIDFTGFIQCCNVTNSVVPFSPHRGFLCGCYCCKSNVIFELISFQFVCLNSHGSLMWRSLPPLGFYILVFS